MNAIFIAIFIILLFLFLLTLQMESVLIIFTGAAIYYYCIFLIIYYPLYFLLKAVLNNRSKWQIHIILMSLFGVCFLGYAILDEYIQKDKLEKEVAQNKQEIDNHKNKWLDVLQNVPESAEIDGNAQFFSISTDNLKNELGYQPSFNWGDFELTSLREYNKVIRVKSLMQPKELPNGVQCDKELVFLRKKSNEVNKGFDSKLFQFNYCDINELKFSLNKQQFQINDTILYYYGKDVEYGYEPHWIEEIKQTAMQLGLKEYWVAHINLPINIEKEWNSRNVAIIFDKTASPIALFAIDIKHQTGLNNMKLKQCIIKSNQPLMILTELQNKKPSLLTNRIVAKELSPNCLNKIEVSVSYGEKTAEDIAKEKALLLQHFSHIDKNVKISWDNNYPLLYSLKVDSDENSFFWGDLKIKGFKIDSQYKKERVGALVNFVDNSTIKLDNFTCDGNNFFEYNPNALSNSLAYENFTLTQCDVKNIDILIKNNPLKINDGRLSYFYSDKTDFNSIKDFEEQTPFKNGNLKSDLFRLKNRLHERPYLRVLDYPFYLEYAVVNEKKEVLALEGSIIIDDENSLLGIEKCKDINIAKSVLKNFTESETELSVSGLDESLESCKSSKKLPYKILPSKDNTIID